MSALDELDDEVERRLGLVFPPSRRLDFEDGVGRSVARTGTGDVAALLDAVRAGDPQAIEALAAELTIGESYFFRISEHFEFVRGQLQRLARAVQGPIVLWSAGCAGGEEAYSLAVSAFEALGVEAQRVRVFASDVNREQLERARRAVYRPWSFRGVSDETIRRWFEDVPDGLRPVAAIRDKVSFFHFNLATQGESGPLAPSSVHLAMCRNVLVYFGQRALRVAADGFATLLVPGGYLMCSPSDPPLPEGDLTAGAADVSRVYVRRAPRPRKIDTRPPRPRKPRPPARAGVERPRAQRPADSSPQLRAAQAADATSAAGLFDEARRAADQDAAERAEQLVNAHIEQAPLDARAFALRATLRQARGDHRGAIADAKRAVFLDDTLAIAYVLLAVAGRAAGEQETARRALRNARVLLMSQPAEAIVPESGGASAAELLALCNEIERTTRTEGTGTP